MKFKKLVLAASSLLAVTTLAGCSGGADAIVDADYQLAAAGELKSGYTSLANTHANGAVDAEGYYAAGGKKFKVKDTFKTTYATEPTGDLFNYLCNQWTYNSRHYTNFVDGLVENDKYGNIVGAIALGYKVENNSDGTQTWKFQLRENAEWVNNKTGKKVANVTANDFVAAAKYVLNPANGSSTANLYTAFVKGAEEYYEALAADQTADFSTVGVKATGDYDLEYTITEPAPYFITLLTYSPYLPVYEEYLNEQGTEFGKTVNNILVNGAFRATTHNPENLFVYTKNYHYFDREHVYVNHIERKFVSGTMPLSTSREWYESGLIDSFSVSSKDKDGFKKYVTGEDGTGTIKNPIDPNCNGIQSYYGATFFGYFNFNRKFYAYDTQAHQQTDAEKVDTARAIWNKNFRLGFLYGLDACKGNEYRDPAEPFNWVVRNYVNKELVSYNGKDFSEYVTDVYNREQGTNIRSLIGIDNGSDPIFDTEKASAYFAAAYEELKDSVANFPVYIDVPGDMDPEVQAYNEAMLAAVENASKVIGSDKKPMVKINWNIASSDDEDTEWFSRKFNFDLNMNTGWGPDYGDPKTYAATLIPFGDEAKYLGFPISASALNKIETDEDLGKGLASIFEGATAKAKMEAAMDEFYGTESNGYFKLYKEADAVSDPANLEQRYIKFAEAEYDSIYESAMIIPWYTANGYSASVSKTVPWQAGRASYGLTEDKLKNVVVTDSAMSKDDRAAVTAEYEAGKAA